MIVIDHVNFDIFPHNAHSHGLLIPDALGQLQLGRYLNPHPLPQTEKSDRTHDPRTPPSPSVSWPSNEPDLQQVDLGCKRPVRKRASAEISLKKTCPGREAAPVGKWKRRVNKINSLRFIDRSSGYNRGR